MRAPEGIRTPNLLIRSQMLYPLSYGRPSRTTSNDVTGSTPPPETARSASLRQNFLGIDHAVRDQAGQ
jgi:hypothetical protein